MNSALQPPDWRGLCEELAGWIERATQHYIQDPELLIRARKALAQPEPEVADGPAVPEGREPAAVVSELSNEELANYLLSAGVDAVEGLLCGNVVAWEGRNEQVMAAIRAAIAADRARFGGRPAPAPAGEVGELVAALRNEAIDCACTTLTSGDLRRIADLLEQRQGAPVPVAVAVSERLPQPEDCDAEGMCWWWYPPVPEQNYGYWIYEDNAVPERSRLEWPDSWLPAHALPLPSGEVE